MTADEAIELVAQEMHEVRGWPVEQCRELVEICRASITVNPQLFYDSFRRDMNRRERERI